MFKQNESKMDKKIRLVVGVVSLLLALFVFTGTIQIIAFVIGVLAIFTGITGFCLLYELFGIKTK
ncbi:MAG: DUF2892 domain-containing protein [Candidatus Shapirobacteria bacterium]|nr:DUF2892 domain-containing protein [Candidatus Shapirobacteria bacterium]